MTDKTPDAPKPVQEQPRRKTVFIRSGGTHTIPDPEKEVTPSADQS